MPGEVISPQETDLARKAELEIIEAAKALMRFESGSLAYGLGRLSLSRSSGAPDKSLRQIINGARQLENLEQPSRITSATEQL